MQIYCSMDSLTRHRNSFCQGQHFSQNDLISYYSESSSEEQESLPTASVVHNTLSLKNNADELEIGTSTYEMDIMGANLSDPAHTLPNYRIIPTLYNETQYTSENFNTDAHVPMKSKVACPAITPRRPSCASASHTCVTPVVISLELLDSLRGLPLPFAASSIGVSATAFKKACRRLGVTRWEYRRGPGRAGRKNLQPPTQAIASSPPTTPESADCSPSPRSYFGMASWSAGEAVDAELAGTNRVELETKGLVDWLGGKAAETGCTAVCDDDVLVLEMLAQPWSLNTACPPIGL